MYMDILRSISGIEVYPLLSLTVFVSVFGGVLVWALRANGARLETLARLPLDGTSSVSATGRDTDPSGERRAQ